MTEYNSNNQNKNTSEYAKALEDIKSRIMKDLKLRIWDMYSVEGLQPKLIKKAFDETMEQIEKEEAKRND